MFTVDVKQQQQDAVVLHSNTKSPTGVHRPFIKRRNCSMPPRGTLAGVSGCILAYGTRIYMVYGWGSEWFLRYKALNEVKGVCHAPRGTPCQCHWMRLSIRKKNYMV